MKFALAALVAIAIAAAIVYPMVRPKPRSVGYCGDCHEMGDSSTAWLGSAHRGVACSDCHGGVMQMGNARRLDQHARGVGPEQIRVRHKRRPVGASKATTQAVRGPFDSSTVMA